jgi:hypothetical protein
LLFTCVIRRNGILEVMFKICFRNCRIEISNDYFFYQIRRPKFGRGGRGGQQRLGQCPKFGTFFGWLP